MWGAAARQNIPGLFRNANLTDIPGEIKANRVWTSVLIGEARRRVIYHLYKLTPQVTINNEKVLLHDR